MLGGGNRHACIRESAPTSRSSLWGRLRQMQFLSRTFPGLRDKTRENIRISYGPCVSPFYHIIFADSAQRERQALAIWLLHRDSSSGSGEVWRTKRAGRPSGRAGVRPLVAVLRRGNVLGTSDLRRLNGLRGCEDYWQWLGRSGGHLTSDWHGVSAFNQLEPSPSGCHSRRPRCPTAPRPPAWTVDSTQSSLRRCYCQPGPSRTRRPGLGIARKDEGIPSVGEMPRERRR